jgi:hypothetical protein
MISTSAFLDSAFQVCALTCDCLVVPGKCVLSVLHQYQSQVCPQVIGLALFSSSEFSALGAVLLSPTSPSAPELCTL